MILNNYSLYFSTIFQRKDNYFFSFSIVHEFFEDLFFRIFDTYIKTVLNGANSFNKKRGSKKEIWHINEEDIDLNLIKNIALDLLSSNFITQLNQNYKQEKSIDDIISLFILKYDKLFNFNDNDNLTNFIKINVKPALLLKIDKYKNTLLDELRTLIEYSLKNIKNGKITLNGKDIYDYKEFFIEYLSRDIKQKNTLSVTQSLAYFENIDNIVYTMKYSKGGLSSLKMNGNFDEKNELQIVKIINAILFYCPNLQKLSLTDNHLNEKYVSELIKLIDNCKSLNYLDLSSNNIGSDDESFKLICESFKYNKSIQTLILNFNQISSVGAFYVADTLIKNTQIENISLASNKIVGNGLSSLLTVLANNNKTIKTFDISDNQLAYEDFANIADLIIANKTIKILNLSNNAFDAQIGNIIGSAFKEGKTTLSSIYLNFCNINNESAPLLFKYLNHSNLNQIYLDNNPIGDIGAILLANILKTNINIKFISLQKCNLTSISLKCLCKILHENNTTLGGLNLTDNMFDDEAIHYLSSVIQSRHFQVFLSQNCLSNKSKELAKTINNIILH